MIKIKTEKEIEILRKGGKILHDLLDELSQKAVAGVSSKELEEIACKRILDTGGRPSFKGYKMSRKIFFPTALCVSINEEIVHGSALPSRILKNGDIVGLDLGMEYPINKNAGNKYSKLGGYYTDSARTVIIGDVDKKIKKLTYYYLNNNKSVSFIGSEKELKKIREKIIKIYNEIKKGYFPPRSGLWCEECDFKEICPYRKI